MEAPVALFTVATDSVANVSAETPAGIRVHVHKPNWPRGRVCRVLTHIVEYVYCQPRGMLCSFSGHPIRTHYHADQKRSDDD